MNGVSGVPSYSAEGHGGTAHYVTEYVQRFGSHGVFVLRHGVNTDSGGVADKKYPFPVEKQFA